MLTFTNYQDNTKYAAAETDGNLKGFVGFWSKTKIPDNI